MNRTTLRQSVLVSAGTVFNSLLGLLFYILVAKNLGVEKFGHFSYLLGLGLLAAELGDLGINSAIVKFGSGDKFSAIFSFAIVQRAIIFVPIIIIFLYLGLFPSAAVAIGLLLAYLTTQGLLARQKFSLQVFANISGNLLRLLLIIATPLSAITVFFLGTIGTFIIGMLTLFKEFKGFDLNKKFAKEILRFSLPAAGSFSLSSIASKIDVPILYSLAGPVAVGLYSSAQKLASVIPQIASALDGVFAPKFSQKSPTALRQYLILAGLISLGILIFIPFSGTLITFVFGNKYLGSETVFQILLLSFIPFFLSGPFLGKILYGLGKTKHLLLVSTVNLIISITGLIILIGIFQANGAALTFVITNTVALVFYVLISFIFRHQAN
mgnify:FL=1